jgi:hypothetical protein
MLQYCTVIWPSLDWGTKRGPGTLVSTLVPGPNKDPWKVTGDYIYRESILYSQLQNTLFCSQANRGDHGCTASEPSSTRACRSHPGLP